MLGPHAGDVRLVGGRVAAKHCKVGIEQDRLVGILGRFVARRRSPALRRVSSGPPTTRARRAPARPGPRSRASLSSASTSYTASWKNATAITDASSLTGTIAAQLAHVTHSPGDVADPVVLAMWGTVRTDDVVERLPRLRRRAHRLAPRNPQLGIVGHAVSVPGRLNDDDGARGRTSVVVGAGVGGATS